MKDVIGFETLYAVTSCGRIWSYKTQKFLSPKTMKNGYLQVALRKNGKYIMKYVHRVVAEAYIPKVLQKNEVNHKDENKRNNSVRNLEWCSHKYNNNYGTKLERQARTRGKKVKCIETNIVYFSVREAERQTNIPNTNISACCNGKIKTAGGYHWKYI